MFKVENDTIRMTIGDTGTLIVNVDSKRVFTSNDRVLMTVKDQTGVAIYEKPVAISNKTATFSFVNTDTEELEAGTYYYDIRFVINPTYSGTTITGGSEVITPKERQQFILLPNVGEV